MYVWKYARGRRVYLTPMGHGLGPASEPGGPAVEGTVVDTDDGILVRIDDAPEGFPMSGWFRADLFVLHGGYRLLGWGRGAAQGHLHFTPRGQPELLFQRASARIPMEARIMYTPLVGDDLTQVGSEGVTQDLSMDGVGLLGNQPVPEGARIRIEFADPPLEQLGGLLARVRSVSEAVGKGWTHQLGCHFEAMDEEQRAALRQIIAERARNLTRPGGSPQGGGQHGDQDAGR